MTTTKLDKVAILEQLLYIDNKAGQVVPYKPNKMQAYFLRNKTNRNIVLKHRQGGLSSVVLADMFTDSIFIPHTTCAVVSHETHATQRLLDRIQFYYDTMLPPKPQLGAGSRSEKSFPELHSSIYVGTAGSRAFGRGDTIRKVLLSELAHYEDAETILNGVEDAVPLQGEVIIECTPNGEDNVFYDRWVRAREGRSPYKPFFFEWWWTEDYSIPADSMYALPEDRCELKYTPEEEDLATRNHLTQDQIRWRRWKIAEKGGLFWQEYPEDEVSCFITVGAPVFDTNILNNLAQKCYDGERHKEGWQYWKAPVQGEHYLIGADTAAGSPTGSFSAAVVLNAQWEVCATFQARLQPNEFARILKEMGKWYNYAELAIERNFTGYAVIGQLTDYPKLYHQRDFTTGKVSTNIGWWTNDQTKPYLFTVLKEHLPRVAIWDVNLIRQIRGYRFLKMKPIAQTFDDMAMAFMIAIAAKGVTGVAQGYRGSARTFSW
jgi:hypothetical protein